MTAPTPIVINYFSDVLCVWAYIAQIRINELKKEFGQSIQINYHFTPVFGDIETRIEKGWQAKGGYLGYAKHVQETAKQFPHINLHPDVWHKNPPHSSANVHLFLKAAQLSLVEAPDNFETLVWQMRHAFFHNAIDIGTLNNQLAIAETLNLPTECIINNINNGLAIAALCRDDTHCQEHHITGSPSYLFNNGRQKLYGNIGYKILAANIHELIRQPEQQASWC